MERTWERQGRHRTPVPACESAGRGRGDARRARTMPSPITACLLASRGAARRTKASLPPRLFLLTVFAYYHASLIPLINLL